MSRRRAGIGIAVVGAAALALVAPVAATNPPVDTGSAGESGADGEVVFELPADRIDALAAAGSTHVVVGDYPEQPADVAWPTEQWSYGPLPAGADAAAIQQLLATAFPDDLIGEGGGVHAVIAVHHGEIVLQRYKVGYEPSSAHVSWSMAKSITQALFGAAIVDGAEFDLYGPAPVPEWADPGDPRHPITIDELLMMRSGLQWNEEYAGESDVTKMLFGDGAEDRAGFAASHPLEFEPDTVWEYSTGTSMILGRIVGDEIGFGTAGVEWAQEHLFGPLGITTVEHDLDGTGAMSNGSNINMSAQDFARFGLLYLRNGVWDGTQILPTNWVDYARLPSPDAEGYGHQWWINGNDERFHDRFPTMFSANGFAGQIIVVVPELDLVVVVVSNDSSAVPDETAFGLVEAFADAE